MANSRFLILPWVRLNNLASRVLAEAARRLAADWQRRYGIEALLVETLVDPQPLQRHLLPGRQLAGGGPLLVMTTHGKGVVMRQDDLRPATRKAAGKGLKLIK